MSRKTEVKGSNDGLGPKAKEEESGDWLKFVPDTAGGTAVVSSRRLTAGGGETPPWGPDTGSKPSRSGSGAACRVGSGMDTSAVSGLGAAGALVRVNLLPCSLG